MYGVRAEFGVPLRAADAGLVTSLRYDFEYLNDAIAKAEDNRWDQLAYHSKALDAKVRALREGAARLRRDVPAPLFAGAGRRAACVLPRAASRPTRQRARRSRRSAERSASARRRPHADDAPRRAPARNFSRFAVNTSPCIFNFILKHWPTEAVPTNKLN